MLRTFSLADVASIYISFKQDGSVNSLFRCVFFLCEIIVNLKGV